VSLLSFDLETHQIQPGLLAPPIVCGSFADRSLFDGGVVCTKAEILSAVAGWLEDTDTTFVGANIAYDWGCILAVRPDLLPRVWAAYEEGRVFDVQIAASLNAIADGRMRDGGLFRMDGSCIQSGRYSLDECVREWLGREDAKENDRWRLSYALLEHTPIEQWPYDARQYPVDDAVNTLEVAEQQLKKARNLHDQEHQAHVAFCLHLGALWGLRTDPVRVAAFKTEVDKHVVELRDYSLKAGLLKPKTKKPGAELSKNMAVIKERVFNAYNGNPPHTEKGATKTDRETLEDSGDLVLEKFAEVGKWEKFNTYVPSLEAASTVPLNVKPNVLVSTGRTSYDGLIQLMPRRGGVRECFVARHGCSWSSVDYSFVELVTLSQCCIDAVGSSELADAINADMDPHCILGADLMGITYEAFVELYAAKDPGAKDIRQAAKAGNFGYPGMMGYIKFVTAQKKAGYSVCEWFLRDGQCGGTHIVHEWEGDSLEQPLCCRCIEQSQVIRERYLGRWKEVPKYWNWVMGNVRRDDAITHFVDGRVRGSPHGPAAANSYFQGRAARGAKLAVIALTKEMYLVPESPLYGSRLMVFAHDETLLEIPDEKLHEAAHRQAEIMVEKMREVCPDVKVKAAPAAMKNWWKEADAVYAEGRLVPWYPKVTA
jgi:hypothetical protein